MRSLRPCSDSSATPSYPSQLEWKVGLPWPKLKKRGCNFLVLSEILLAFNLCFPNVANLFLPKLIMLCRNLVNYTFVSRTETLIFFLYLNPTETGKLFRFPAALSGKQRRPLPNRCKNRKIFWGTWEGRNSPKAIRCNL